VSPHIDIHILRGIYMVQAVDAASQFSDSPQVGYYIFCSNSFNRSRFYILDISLLKHEPKFK
jgi:hypothetical protein